MTVWWMLNPHLAVLADAMPTVAAGTATVADVKPHYDESCKQMISMMANPQ